MLWVLTWSCHHILVRTLGLLLLLGGSSAFHLYGIEKHWIAHEARICCK